MSTKPNIGGGGIGSTTERTTAPQSGPPESELAKLEFAFKVRAYHHNAIWEEQKHFTWLISVLLSAQLIILTSDKIPPLNRAVLVVFGSIIGTVLAVTAFRVQRREGNYFRSAAELYVHEYNRVYSDLPLAPPPKVANKPIGTLILAFVAGKAGVRDYFQILFLAFVSVFGGMAAYAILPL